jgi:hypothetical protein
MKIPTLIKIFFLILLMNNCELMGKGSRKLQEEGDSEDHIEGDIKEPVSYRSNKEYPKSLVVCNQKMMNSYGITGLTTAADATHKYCPMIHKNCCSPKDEIQTVNLWNTDGKEKVEIYYSTYLMAIKYLLGFADEGMHLAGDFENHPNEICKNASYNYINLNFNQNIAKEIFRNLEYSLEQMSDYRKGFYCFLCDAKTQEVLRDFWEGTDNHYKNRLYLSQDFCKRIVNFNIKSSYYIMNYVKKYLENFTTLMSCKANVTTTITYDIPHDMKIQIRNCFFFRDKYFFFFCEKYCEGFHISKPSPLFDGDIDNLKTFVRHFILYRVETLYYPNVNFLVKSVTEAESYLQRNMEDVSNISVFFSSTNGNLKFDEMKMDVVYHGGVGIMDSAENALYTMILEETFIFRTLLFFVLLVLV